VVTRYFTHGDRTVAMDRGTLTWLAGDHQGTSGLAINTGTLSVSQRRQDPYGVPRGEAVSWPGDRGFLGGTRDAGTGLTQLGERAYDPAVGRFISADPVVDLSDPQQMHGYAYANNSPVSFSDPSGLLRSGPDGECPRGCMYKPGHNPATNDPVDFAWNSRNCPRGTWDCTATGGTGKPPQNRSPQNCPDGKAPCRVAKGSKSKEQLELERRLLAAKIARRLSIHLEMKVGPLGPDADKYLEEMKKKAVEILSKPTQSFSVCATLQAGLIVHVESEMCFTADDYGMTFNTADKTSLQFGGGATVGLAFKANTERADQVNQKFTPSRSVGVDIVPGIGGGVEWEYDDDRQSSLTAKVDAGLRGTIGPKLAFDGSAANYGYMFRWQDL
jgi:RHS repeat-associated protein